MFGPHNIQKYITTESKVVRHNAGEVFFCFFMTLWTCSSFHHGDWSQNVLWIKLSSRFYFIFHARFWTIDHKVASWLITDRQRNPESSTDSATSPINYRGLPRIFTQQEIIVNCVSGYISSGFFKMRKPVRSDRNKMQFSRIMTI